MKKKSLNFIVPLVQFPFDVMVSIAQTDAEFKRSLLRHLPPNCLKDLEEDPDMLTLGNTVDGRTVNYPTGHQTIIRMKRYPVTPVDYGHISHEIFHAVTFILWRMSIPFEIEKTDEIYAYTIDYLTAEIYKKL